MRSSSKCLHFLLQRQIVWSKLTKEVAMDKPYRSRITKSHESWHWLNKTVCWLSSSVETEEKIKIFDYHEKKKRTTEIMWRRWKSNKLIKLVYVKTNNKFMTKKHE